MVNIADMPRGIDVSKFQGSVNWSSVAESGISFGFARIIDDKTGTTADPFFARNWSGMKNAGIMRGAYHFFRPNRNVAAAANLFVSLIGGSLEEGDLPPVLDVENNSGGLSASQYLDAIAQWMDIVEGALNRQAMIYTFTPFWRDTLGNSSRFSDHPLWIAHFTNAPQPNFPSAFPTFSFWQFTQNGSCPGVSGNVDLDRFNGSMDGLRAFAGFPRPVATEADPQEQAAQPVAMGIAGDLTGGVSAEAAEPAQQAQPATRGATKKGSARKGTAKSGKKGAAKSAKAARSSKSSKKGAASKKSGAGKATKAGKGASQKSAKKKSAKKAATSKKEGGSKRGAAKSSKKGSKKGSR